MKAIYKKEMQGYFTSMIAYLFMAGFVLLVGIYFTVYCVVNSVADFAGYVLPSTCIGFIYWYRLLPCVFGQRRKSRRQTNCC